MGTTTKAAKKSAGMDMRISVKADDLAALDATASTVIDAAEVVKSAAEALVAAIVSPQQRHHRRVQVTIQDGVGSQISGAVYDLMRDDELAVNINGDRINAAIGNTAAR